MQYIVCIFLWIMIKFATNCYGIYSDCPLSCNCTFTNYESNLTLRCSKNTDLDEFFSRRANIVDLDFQQSLLNYIPPALCHLTQLIALDLAHNNITDIIPRKLQCFKNLISLDFSYNQLSYLEEDAFFGLTFIEYIRLEYNNLQDVHRNTFLHPTLRRIDLQYNNLTYIDTWFMMISDDHKILVNASLNRIESISNSFNFTINQLPIRPLAAVILDLRRNQIKHAKDIHVDSMNITLENWVALWSLWNCAFYFHYNPWDCDCVLYYSLLNVRWIIKMFVDFGDKTLINVECFTPAEARGTIIYELPVGLFRCDVNASCPPGCICTDHPGIEQMTVDCSGAKGITNLPEELPNSTHIRLNMSRSSVSELSYRTYLVNISQIDLSYNQLLAINSSALQSLEHVSEILVHHNKLTTLPPSIRKVKFSNLTHLTLSGNSFVCDCTNLWLRFWLKQNHDRIPDIAATYCSEQYYLYHENIVDVPEDLFFCDEDPKMFWFIPGVQAVALLSVFMCVSCKHYRCCRCARYYFLEKVLVLKTFPANEGIKFDFTIVHRDTDNAEDLATKVEHAIKNISEQFIVRLSVRDAALGADLITSMADFFSHSRTVIFIVDRDFLEDYEFRMYLHVVHRLKVRHGKPQIVLAFHPRKPQHIADEVVKIICMCSETFDICDSLDLLQDKIRQVLLDDNYIE